MKIQIQSANNGWIVESNESRREPQLFEFDGTNRFKTSLENIVMTAERALDHVFSQMIGSTRYRVKIVEEEEENVAKPIQPAGDFSTEALPGGLPASGSVDAKEVSP